MAGGFAAFQPRTEVEPSEFQYLEALGSLPDSKDLIADWRAPMACGNFNVKTGQCGGKGY